MKKKLNYIILILLIITISQCSGTGYISSIDDSNEYPEEKTIEKLEFVIKDGNKIDKKFEHLYDKHKLIVYNLNSFKEITINIPTIIIIDYIDMDKLLFDSKTGLAYDVNCDSILDTTHGMETMNIISDKLNLIGLNLSIESNPVNCYINYYKLIKQKLLNKEQILAIGMPNHISYTYEMLNKMSGLNLTPENIGVPEIREKFLKWLKENSYFIYEIIESINEVGALTRVYLASDNDSSNVEYNYFLSAKNSIAVGGANRNWEYPTTLFSEHSEIDRYDRAVSVMFYTKDGYDTDEDGLTDFKFDEISQTPLKEYPDDIVWNKNLFGEAVENYIIDIEIINEKLIINNKEYEILELINNWDSFIKKHNNNLFNITQLFAMYNEISHIAEQNGYELNDSIKAILENKQVFEMNIGTKATDEGRLFTSLNDFDVLYTKNHENLIVPTKILYGTSYAIEFAINKDYEEGILIQDGD